jgi:hypothetical protein
VLYLFSGVSRRADIRQHLKELCLQNNFELQLMEVDVAKSPNHDLSDDDIWASYLKQIGDGCFNFLIVTPPCSTWSRACFSNSPGPTPVRSGDYPWGLPWLKGEQKAKAELGSLLIHRAIDACIAASKTGTGFLFEHPEDLGMCPRGMPASIWRLPQMRELVSNTDAVTVAFHQCALADVDFAKPTRIATTASLALKFGHSGWPKLNRDGHYVGPLPRSCGHKHTPLIGQDSSGSFKTAPTAAYPPAICKLFATLAFSQVHRSSPAVGGKQIHDEITDSKLTSTTQILLKDIEDEYSQLEATSKEIDFTLLSGRTGTGPPLHIKQGGCFRSFHDGSGLCSPGRWKPEMRQDHTGLSSAIRTELLALLTSKLGVDGFNKLMYGLACGKFQDNPFEKKIIEAGVEVFKNALLNFSGVNVDCSISDGQPFRLHLLAAFLREMGDPDFGELVHGENCFANGVRLGVETPLPRAPAVFEERANFRKYDDPGDIRDKDNYSSAKDHGKELLEQFSEEIQLGAMIAMDEAAARKEFGNRFLVAALGAIEKNDGSFRVIHDGTHGVGVNPRIKILDQQRCPTAAELRVALRSLPTARFTLAADIKRAHRLVKICRRDWGYQACKIDSEDSSLVYLNTVGTFGIASAAYHWQRLAGCITRAILYVMGREKLFQLIFADDLEWLSAGENALFNTGLALFLLSIFGTPMSWKKTKASFRLTS